MLSPEQNYAVVRYLIACSSRPKKALGLWSKLYTVMDWDTGQILRTREELATMQMVTPDVISGIMTELERAGAIIRRRERVAGMRGAGRVVYFMNPAVSPHLAEGSEHVPLPKARMEERARASGRPALQVIQGRKAS